ncbi:MAG: ATP-dependent DNA helicase [Clostridia bacterium]|nr:ATP-dependent DNA helicase [Clostridia bacterium]
MLNIGLAENGEILISAKELSAFAEKRIRPGSVDYSPSGPCRGYAEFSPRLSCTVTKDDEIFIVTGEPYCVYTYGNDKTVIEAAKQVKKLTSSVNPLSDPAFLAEAYIYAYLVCKARSASSVVLKLKYFTGSDEKYFDITLDSVSLEKTTVSLLERASYFAAVKKQFELEGRSKIETMKFPFFAVRDGQREFIKEAYRAISHGERLLVSAPTGIGKTISALYPAVKAVGAGLIEKVFYLTAKTVTGVAAAKTAKILMDCVPGLRAVTIISKERCCPANDKKIDFTVDRCSFDCPRLRENESGSYRSRRDAALKELLSENRPYGKADISSAAEKYGICPYELSLDLSEYCQIVICDYNYAIDPRVRFRRYFVEGDLRYALLIDEAHNLPDRTRDTFSSTLDRDRFRKLYDALSSSPAPNFELISKIKDLLTSLDYECGSCLKEAEESGGEKFAYIVSDSIPGKLFKAANDAAAELSKARIRERDDTLSGEIDDAYTAVSGFIKAYEYFGEGFVFYTELEGEKFAAKILCLDPSWILDRVMSGAVSSILFSATLTPLDYFAEITGCATAKTLMLNSPYDPDMLSVSVIDTVSTKYLVREETAESTARMILAAISAKAGHYIVYFPSYKYMDTVFAAFCKIAPKGISAIVQKQSMSLGARNKFLSFFENESEEGTLVGFCVLGGIFSEGIDLPDEKLIGVVLVGIGLPSLSSELNILKEYYDKTRENGYEFAYLYPAMIKISQAAGRVIRGENDRGIIILIDDRYKDPAIRALLPAHWKDIHVTGNEVSLTKILTEFWKDKNI